MAESEEEKARKDRGRQDREGSEGARIRFAESAVKGKGNQMGQGRKDIDAANHRNDQTIRTIGIEQRSSKVAKEGRGGEGGTSKNSTTAAETMGKGGGESKENFEETANEGRGTSCRTGSTRGVQAVATTLLRFRQ